MIRREVFDDFKKRSNKTIEGVGRFSLWICHLSDGIVRPEEEVYSIDNEDFFHGDLKEEGPLMIQGAKGLKSWLWLVEVKKLTTKLRTHIWAYLEYVSQLAGN